MHASNYLWLVFPDGGMVVKSHGEMVLDQILSRHTQVHGVPKEGKREEREGKIEKK